MLPHYWGHFWFTCMMSHTIFHKILVFVTMGEYQHMHFAVTCSVFTFEQGVVCWSRHIFISCLGIQTSCYSENHSPSVCSSTSSHHSCQEGVIHVSETDISPLVNEHPPRRQGMIRALILVQSKLRVALNKSWPRLIWNTLVVRTLTIQWVCRCVHQVAIWGSWIY